MLDKVNGRIRDSCDCYVILLYYKHFGWLKNTVISRKTGSLLILPY